MKISFKIVVSIFIFFSIGILLFMYRTQKVKDENVLIVGTSADYPPYSFIDIKTQKIKGFDIDVVKEVALRLHKKIKIKDIPFAMLILDLLSGEIDIIAAGLSPTTEKAKKVNFSHIYLKNDPFVILSKKDKNIISLQDLIGKKVVVNTGYTADTYMSDKPGIDLVRLKTPADSFMALKSGSVDAYVAARSSLLAFLQQTDNVNQFSLIILPETGDGCALVIAKENIQLLQQINNIIEQMEQDKTLEILRKKWNLEI